MCLPWHRAAAVIIRPARARELRLCSSVCDSLVGIATRKTPQGVEDAQKTPHARPGEGYPASATSPAGLLRPADARTSKQLHLVDRLHQVDVEARVCGPLAVTLLAPARHGHQCGAPAPVAVAIWRAVSSPSIPGMPRSSSTTSGWKSLATATASTPLWPSGRRDRPSGDAATATLPRRRCRRPRGCDTARRRAAGDAAGLAPPDRLPWHRRQPHRERRAAAAAFAGRRDAAAVHLCQATQKREADAEAALSRRLVVHLREQIEDRRDELSGNADAGVGDANHDVIALEQRPDGCGRPAR